MTLTQEQKTDVYPAAPLEGSGNSSALTHEKKFYNIDNAQLQLPSGVPAYQNNNSSSGAPNYVYPAGVSANPTANSTKMYKLDNTTQKTGLGITLKVMSGDNIDIYAKSFYKGQAGYNSSNSGISDLLGQFINALNNNNLNNKGVTVTNLTNNINTGANDFFNSQFTGSGTDPKAGICWILFDEQLNYVTANFDRVSTTTGTNGVLKNHSFNVPIVKSGYLYVYASNESNVPVFFDNLQLVHNRGPLVDETHYYAFGLTMARISSKAASFGGAENKKKYQNYEYNNDFDINLYESFYRSHDPQLGRFWQIDPKPNELESQYAAMGNNPIKNIDVLGDTIVPVYILQDMWPDVYTTHTKGIAKNPSIVQSNGTILIDYDPIRSNANKRRYDAKTANNATNPNPALFQIDEFPYASTKQGGKNAATNLVPKKQNREHGTYLGVLVLAAKMKDGDQFNVILVPSLLKKKPDPKPVPVPVPVPAKKTSLWEAIQQEYIRIWRQTIL
jgi:RHS repeat-associated protein